MILGIVVAVAILAGVVALVIVDTRQEQSGTPIVSNQPNSSLEVRKRVIDLRFQWASTVISAVGVVGAMGAAVFAGGAYIAAKGQLDAMRDDARPWIRVVLDPRGIDWGPIAEATGGNEDDSQIYATVNSAITIMNIGKSPAFNLAAKIIPVSFVSTRSKNRAAYLTNSDRLQKAQKEVCNRAETKAKSSVEIEILFPNENTKIDDSSPFGVPKAAPSEGNSDTEYRLYLIGCVYYQSGANLENHRTSFSYFVRKGQHDIFGILRSNENLGSNEIFYARREGPHSAN